MKKVPSARISQLLFLALFVVLFVQTEYRGADELSTAVNSFFRADSLVAVSYLLAAKTWNWLILPGLLLLLATSLLGRFFCGWICPLGTILDLLAGRFVRRGPLRLLQGNTRYWVLLPLLTAALAGVNLAGIFDPIAILLRGLSLALYPILGDGVRQGWIGLYGVIGEQRDLLAPAFQLVRDHLLPFRETFYPLAFASFAMLVAIIALEATESRAWCRRLCPFGTLLGLASRFSLVRRSPVRVCADCKACRDICPTSFDRDLFNTEECIRCFACEAGCRNRRVGFRLGRGADQADGYLPERRVLLGGMVSGLFLSRLFRFREPVAQARLLRPPGVQNERAFLAACVRCGECLKVCLKSALYPAVGQAGLEGLFTPLVVPRLGYCEYNCTLCGQVCPTGAIPRLPIPEKRRAVIGKAVLDKNHCLPFAKKTNCIVCEEHCPIPTKAIRSERVLIRDPSGRELELQLPYVVDELCNGCGICENVCPLEGKAGIDVFAVRDRTPLKEPDTASEAWRDPYGH
jgi:MauM/NapG family ferredoxin protein